jgi:hypothetical protein
MAHRIQIARAWCDECLCDCWFAYDESTRISEHLGTSNAKKWEELKAQGYQVTHRGGGVFTFTQWKAAPLALPLEWQILADNIPLWESKQPEYVQDW